jgi:flagellar protein FliS
LLKLCAVTPIAEVSDQQKARTVMNAMAALKQYQTVNTQAQAVEASPHRLIQMLMEGGLTRLAQARGAMERGQLALKGELISKAIGIVGGLRNGLNLEQGGEVAANLDNLYEYMVMRLVEANVQNEIAPLDEVAGLLRNVKSGWDAIAE